MSIKHLVTLSLVTLSSLALAQTKDRPATPAVRQPVPPPSVKHCYELSADGKLWSKTPELMCVDGGDKNVAITLTTGMPPSPTEAAVFHFDLKSRVRCPDCNKDQFALTNPSNSVLNALAISFDGKRDLKTGAESGTVMIGKTKLFYRSVK